MKASSFSLKAPAKINWFLKVLGLRNDGYHEIRSLVQKVTLYDELTFFASADIILRSDLNIPVKKNLVYKAAKLLKDRYNVRKGVTIQLKKNIPVGAGLGGGSSDAATTLCGLNELWSLYLPRDELCKVAEEIGSDVPFFLHGALSLVEGRGEKISEYTASQPLCLLLVKPSFDISTGWVYKNFSTYNRLTVGGTSGSELTKKSNKVDNIGHFINCIGKADISCISRYDNVSNDLESVSLRAFPLIAEIKEKILREGAVFSLMSGSGPTVFGVFDSQKRAERASGAFKDFWTAVVKTIIKEN